MEGGNSDDKRYFIAFECTSFFVLVSREHLSAFTSKMFSCDMPFAPNLDGSNSSYLRHRNETTRLDRVAACLALFECPAVDIVAYWIGPLVDVAVIVVQPDSDGGILGRSGLDFAPLNEQPLEIKALCRVSRAKGCVVDVDLKYSSLFLGFIFAARHTYTPHCSLLLI